MTGAGVDLQAATLKLGSSWLASSVVLSAQSSVLAKSPGKLAALPELSIPVMSVWALYLGTAV